MVNITLIVPCEYLGAEIGDRMRELYEKGKKHKDEHYWAFADGHLMLSCIGAHDTKMAKQIVESAREFIK